jgi:hypothetical protein
MTKEDKLKEYQLEYINQLVNDTKIDIHYKYIVAPFCTKMAYSYEILNKRRGMKAIAFFSKVGNLFGSDRDEKHELYEVYRKGLLKKRRKLINEYLDHHFKDMGDKVKMKRWRDDMKKNLYKDDK